MSPRRGGRYQWPASALDAEVMKLAHERQRQTGERITAMVREAMVRYLATEPAAVEVVPVPAAEGERRAG